VFGPDGKQEQVIEMGQGTEPTNCCLGDGVLYVTLSGTGQLVTLPINKPALPLYPATR
jgi:gluconolactonase